MSLIKSLAKETMYYGVSSILSRILNYFVLTILLTRVLSQAEYGIYNSVYAFAGGLIILMTFRMETTLFRFGTKKEDSAKAFSTASLSVIGVVILLVIFFLLSLDKIGEALAHSHIIRYYRWFIFIIAIDALSAIPFAKLRLHNRPIKFAALKVLSVIINITLIVFFLLLLPRLNSYTWAKNLYNEEYKLDYLFISNAVASLIVILLLIPEYLKQKFSFDSRMWKKMMIYTFPLFIIAIAGYINQLFNVFLLKWLIVGTTEARDSLVGVFSAAAKIAILINLFTQAFNYAAEPFFFKHANKKDSTKTYANVALAFSMVAGIGVLGILLFTDIVLLLIGKSFHGGFYIVPILLAANYFLGIYYNFSIWYKLKDKNWYGAGITVIGSFITIIVNISLIPKFGILGVAWASLLTYFFMVISVYFFGKKFMPIPYDISRILIYILLSLGLYYSLYYFVDPLMPSKTIKIFVHFIVFVSYVYLFYKIENKKIKELLQNA